MTDTKKTTSREELERIEDAWIESILDASADDLRIEMTQAGEDPNAYVELADKMLAKAAAHCSQERLARAKAEAAAFKAQKNENIVVPFNRGAASGEQLPGAATAETPYMMAARKGKSLSSRDEDAVSRAKERLKRLEAKDGRE